MVSIEDNNQKAAEQFYNDVMKNVKIEEKPAVPSTIEAGEVTLVADDNQLKLTKILGAK